MILVFILFFLLLCIVSAMGESEGLSFFPIFIIIGLISTLIYFAGWLIAGIVLYCIISLLISGLSYGYFIKTFYDFHPEHLLLGFFIFCLWPIAILIYFAYKWGRSLR